MPLKTEELLIRITRMLAEVEDVRAQIERPLKSSAGSDSLTASTKNKPLELKAIQNQLKARRVEISPQTREEIARIEEHLAFIAAYKKTQIPSEGRVFPLGYAPRPAASFAGDVPVPALKYQQEAAGRFESFLSLQNSIPFQKTWQVLLVLGVILTVLVSIFIAYGNLQYTVYLVGGILGLVLAVFIFLRPEMGAHLLIITTVTSLSDLFTDRGLPSINQPVVALTLVCILANQLLRTGRVSLIFKLTRVEWSMLIYYVVVLGSIYVANDRAESISILTSFTKNIVIVYCLIAALNTPEKWRRGIWLTIICAATLSAMGAFQLVTGSDFTFWGFARASILGQLTDQGSLRYGGPIGDSNIWSQILVAAIPLMVYRVINEKSTNLKVFSMIAALFTFAAIFYTYSRGAFVTTLIILFLIALERRIDLTKGLFIVGIGLVMLTVLPQNYVSRIGTLTDIINPPNEYSASQDESILGRLSVIKVGYSMFQTHPFLGIGVGNYPGEYWSYAPGVGVESGVITTDEATSSRQPHNLYIEVLAETGLFGFLSFITFAFFLVSALWRRRMDTHADNPSHDRSTWTAAILMAVLTYLISGLFLHGVLYRYFWMFLALAMASLHLPVEHIKTFTSQIKTDNR